MGIFSRKEKPLEERVNDIISSDDKVRYIIEKNPGLRNYMVESYRRASEKGKGLNYMGNFIDKVRKPLGILKLIGNLAGPGIGYLASGLTRLGELALFAIPYSIYYGLKGGQAKEVGKVVGAEVAKMAIPYGDAANFVPLYSNAAKNYVNNTAKKYFLDTIRQKGLDINHIDTGNNLEEVIKEQPLPSRSNPIGTSPRKSPVMARQRV